MLLSRCVQSAEISGYQLPVSKLREEHGGSIINNTVMTGAKLIVSKL